MVLALKLTKPEKDALVTYMLALALQQAPSYLIFMLTAGRPGSPLWFAPIQEKIPT